MGYILQYEEGRAQKEANVTLKGQGIEGGQEGELLLIDNGCKAQGTLRVPKGAR